VRALGLTLLILLLTPALAAGHSSFVQSEPAPGAALDDAPNRIRIAVAAPAESVGLALSVLAPEGEELVESARVSPEDPQALEAELAAGATPGSYRVRWRVLSRDGHVRYGLYRFSVDEPPPDAAVVEDDGAGAAAMLARALILAGPILLLGLVATRIGVVGPATDASGDRLWWQIWLVGISLWALGLAVLLVETNAAVRAEPFGGFSTAGDPGIGQILTDTRWGRAWTIGAGLALLAYVTELVARRAPRGAWGAVPQLWGLALAPAGALVVTSWAGHASSGADTTVSIAVDAVHNLASGLWIGGLAALFALVVWPARALSSSARVAAVAPAVVRFSSLAVGAVTVLVISGVYRALVELESLADLGSTDYGRALVVKLALFVALLGVGAYNRFVAHPRLERAHLGLADGDRGAASALVRTVRVELLLSAALLVSVGVLVSLPPPG
jgi:copper transport protein